MVTGVIIVLAGAARAEMKDWQLRRVLNFRSECQMDDFVDKSAPTGPGRFRAICRNKSAWPSGAGPRSIRMSGTTIREWRPPERRLRLRA